MRTDARGRLSFLVGLALVAAPEVANDDASDDDDDALETVEVIDPPATAPPQKTETPLAPPVEDAIPDDVKTAEAETVEGVKLGAVPTLTYGSDDGFGTGGVATLYFHEADIKPYKAAVTLNIFITHKLIQAHRIRFEGLQMFGLPLRVMAQVGYYSTVTQNFCGYGMAVSCDPNAHRDALIRDGVDPGTPEYAVRARQSQWMRFLRPYGAALARYQLWDKPHRVELWGGWRGNWYIPGEISIDGFFGGEFWKNGPYAPSTWKRAHYLGQPGFSSVFQAGFTVDDRDEEIQPNSGYFIESSVRASSFLFGSNWDYLGTTTSGSLFVPVWDGPLSKRTDLVFAHRVVFDFIYGTAPVEDMARIGGLTDIIAFGGQDMGRGIREHRYLGNIKVMSQTELRWSFVDFTLLEQDLTLGLAGFTDIGWIGYRLDDWRGEYTQLVGGAGASFRILWNDNFAIRFDSAVSPHESLEPKIYIRVGNAF